MSPPAPSSKRGLPRAVWFLLLVTALGAGGLAWYLIPRTVPPSVAALTANNRGIGHMEQFDYFQAVKDFEEVVTLAPGWLPGQINLAIALLNTDDAANLRKASELFTQVLKQDPDNPYAHFCLGIILRHQNKTAEAIPHFEAVTRIDPGDAAAWYWLGNVLPEEQEERILQCLAKAHELNPYLRGPIYGLAMRYRATDPKKSEALLAEMKNLDEATWIHSIDVKYTEMGRYAEAIGAVPVLYSGSGRGRHTGLPRPGPLPLFLKDDAFSVQLAGTARWAGAADLKGAPDTELLARLRERFGAVLVELDFNRDDKPDLLLLGAVVDNGRVRDLLLRNEGNGRFTDVTAEAGLAAARVSLACCVADFDNDGFPDIALTSTSGFHIFRNNQKGGFEDVTKQAGLGGIDALCLGVVCVDLDQDGDLDLVIAPYTSRDAVAKALTKDAVPPPFPLLIYINVGEAAPAQPDKNPPPLTSAFRKLEGNPDWLGQPEHLVNILVTDLDRDGDLDLLVFADGKSPTAILNDRLLRFHRQTLPAELAPPGNWNGGLVLDANHDDILDLALIGEQQRVALLLGRPSQGEPAMDKLFERDAAVVPALLHAEVADIDLDSFSDIVGLSEAKRPLLLHNSAGRMAQAIEAFGRDADWPTDLIAVRIVDANGDGFPALLVWSAGTGLHWHASRGNGNHALRVQPVGQRRVDKHKMRTNADAIGAIVTVQTENRWTVLENATLEAGLGQSRRPLVFGLGRQSQADVIRIRWPDNTRQAEFGRSTDRIVRIEESNRKPTSCPVLFAWDGSRFVFITDFLGAGSMGERQPDGTCRPPRPEESIKIEAHQLQPRDGKFVLKLAEPMDEVTYLDRLQLVVLDHPAAVEVYPDERMATAGPPPTQELQAFREKVFPASACDHRGRDLTHTLRQRDRLTADGFDRRSWLGIAAEHWVELDFADRLARFGPKDRLLFCLAGWTDYAYPETIWAATQAGVSLLPPVLERRTGAAWEKVAEIGFPAGMPRVMTYELTGKLAGPHCELRLRTNLEVYWDQVFIAPILETVSAGSRDSEHVRATCLEVESAMLSAPGCMLEYSPDGREPTLYDYDRLSSAPATRLKGKLTRLGDVAELLRQRDDRFVIFGPGDEVSVNFDASRLPQLPPGWKRSYVLRTWGYCKDAGPFTATGDTIEPLPFAAMSRYPYGPREHYPSDSVHKEYQQRYLTRESR